MNIAIPSKHTALVQRAQAQSLRIAAQSLRIASSIAILVICICSSAVSWSQERWTVEQAKKWQEERGWLVGANYLPAYAINQLEMWQIGTYDPERIDKELGWAQSLGFNSMRVFLHDLSPSQDRRHCHPPI